MDELPDSNRTWSIRKATLDDAETVARLRMAMIVELDLDPDAPTLVDEATATEANVRYTREHLGRDFDCWLAIAGGRPVASAAIIWFAHAPSMRHPTGLEAYILNVYTEPEWRGKGVARALMNTLLDAAEERGALRVWLRASTQGRPLYEKLGFGPRNYLELGERQPDV